MQEGVYGECLENIVWCCKQVFGEELTGVYLHGSLAMGCFNPKKSDLDLIVVVGQEITMEQKIRFLEEVMRLNGQAPAKGIELSVVKKEYCQNFVHPTPYELHFSNAHLQWIQDDLQGYAERMSGTDRDLAAHFMVIIKRGITLYGEKIDRVFARIPKDAYMDSIWYDISGAEEEIRQNPVYVTLNLCRAEAFRREGVVLSKKEGGEWGLEELPAAYRPLIRDVLKSYSSKGVMEGDRPELVKFAGFMLGLMRGDYEEAARKSEPVKADRREEA